mmetsp:Transcript_99293/g.250729  ORF Transcript_99293/g.250729 Transcript_99293/m.250729 type:complete len:373 (-) Transcript_99293:134-1252(-)
MRCLLRQQALCLQPLHLLLGLLLACDGSGLKPFTFYDKGRKTTSAWIRFEASLDKRPPEGDLDARNRRGKASLGQVRDSRHAGSLNVLSTDVGQASIRPERVAERFDKFLDASDADDQVDCEECQGLLLNYHGRLRTSAYPQLWACFLVLSGGLLLWLLNDTTEHFFTPPLLYWSKRLQLRPEVAGATLLAIGNGAPDLSDAMAAANAEDLPLALSELLGSNAFCLTCTVSACVMARLMRPAAARQEMAFDRGRFIESLAWYSIGLMTLLMVLSDAKVTPQEAILLPLVYCGYVVRLLHSMPSAVPDPTAQAILGRALETNYGSSTDGARSSGHDPRLRASSSSSSSGSSRSSSDPGVSPVRPCNRLGCCNT